MENSKSLKEQRIRKITHLYYSRPEVQKAIFDFSKNRETIPRYFEGFGRRPDSLQYPGDVFELAKKGATSFHCSEEIWKNPLDIATGMSAESLNEMREGWDLLIDIDCKWIDFSKKAALSIIQVLDDYRVKNIGIKFSGSKGFHIIIPWKSFPKILNGVETKKLFPELPRKAIQFISSEAEKKLSLMLDEDFYDQFKNTQIRKGIKCNSCNQISRESFLVKFLCNGFSCNREEEKKMSLKENEAVKPIKCPDCKGVLEMIEKKIFYECLQCKTDSFEYPNSFSRHMEIDLFDLMGLDIILVSPRHLFRAPYSLHEKTALASIVLSKEELKNFDLKDADPSKIKIKNFIPDSEEGEASELLMQALDWDGENKKPEEVKERREFAAIKLDKLSDDFLPPSIKKILEGMEDGKKRALFVLINLFRSIGMEKEEFEKRIYEWNKKNKPPLPEGYIKAQFAWSYRNKIVPPPNFDKDYYKGIGIIPTEEELRLKNPVNYVVRKSTLNSKKDSSKNKNKQNTKDNFKK